MPACENVSSFGASRITHLIASKQYDGGRKVCDALVKDAHFKSHDVLLLSYQSGKAADICELLLKIIIVISCQKWMILEELILTLINLGKFKNYYLCKI